MKIRPKINYRLHVGHLDAVDSTLVYDAIDATNQPDWEAEGKVFLLCDYEGKPSDDGQHAILLSRGEYEIV